MLVSRIAIGDMPLGGDGTLRLVNHQSDAEKKNRAALIAIE